jgi:biopolymer transport protein TolR
MADLLQGTNRRRRYRPMAEINVTPMVDVMLVLLVIFMVTAPLLTSSVNIDLPKVNATPLNQDNEPLQVSVNSSGQVFLMDQAIDLNDLVTKLQAISQDQKDRRIFVRGDRANSYGRMMEVMGTIIMGGFTKVSLLTEQPGPAAAGTPTPVPAVTPAPGTTPAPATTKPAAPAAPPAAPATSTAGPRRQGRG